MSQRPVKRAITLAGGGPAAGLHIGALDRLAKAGITFDVWALSCIGAWVGLVYNQCDAGKEAEQTYDFFRNNVFRDDVSYSRFPINRVFGPDWGTTASAVAKFVADPKSYQNLVMPEQMAKSALETMKFFSDPSRWNEGDFNNWFLNHVMAVNPMIRFTTSLMYLSELNGLARIYYPDSQFLKGINFDRLYQNDKPFIFHNAWNISRQQLDLFSNQTKPGYKRMNAQSLCACSALPYVEETVEIDGDTYCEGALIDTVSFKNLVEDNPKLEEIWIIRIVDDSQVRAPRNLTEGLGNLCMLFAATVGDDDIKLFRYHVEHEGTWRGKIIEVEVSSTVNFEWSHSNLDRGREAGYRAADEALEKYARGEFKNVGQSSKKLREVDVA
jgi:predicted acylesterase/phospholipase RssA